LGRSANWGARWKHALLRDSARMLMKEAALRNGEMRRGALGSITKRKSGVEKLHPAKIEIFWI
jgi:hypothetical protein